MIMLKDLFRENGKDVFDFEKLDRLKFTGRGRTVEEPIAGKSEVLRGEKGPFSLYP
jgi:hypothetical protein